jgi:hypothetical protein
MARRALLLGFLLAGSAGIGWENVAAAQATAPSSGARAESPTAERQRLRDELARVQTEIDQLKRADRGLRTDYRLRARMADAEALARRLTELDAIAKRQQPAGAGAGPAADAVRIGQEPAAAITDGPAELEAKADILADQSRRVQLQVAALKARIDQVRGRQELRRRAHQLDNDPFAPLEGSKRRVTTPVTRASADQIAPGITVTGQPTTTDRAPPTGGAGPSAPGPTSITSGATSNPGPSPPTPSTPSPPAATTPSAQLRDVLDPATLAQLRKLERDGSPSGDLESMQRAMAALAARAQHLSALSVQLRAQARAH